MKRYCYMNAEFEFSVEVEDEENGDRTAEGSVSGYAIYDRQRGIHIDYRLAFTTESYSAELIVDALNAANEGVFA